MSQDLLHRVREMIGQPASKIVAIYVVTAGIWVVLSDQVLAWGEFDAVWAQTIKGWSFVAVTATLLWFLIYRSWKERQRLEARLREAEKMEALGQLAGGVAHDFNNLLTPILGYTSLVISRLPESDPNQAKLQEVMAAGQTASAVVRELLLFSKRSAREQREACDVTSVVRDMAALLRALVGRNINVRIEADGEPLPVSGRRAQLEQIILNLVTNAREAMRDGGELVLTVASLDGSDDLAEGRSALEPGPCIVLTVCDVGTGMDAATRQRIFEPFFTTKRGGTGIGMPTVAAITRQLGGEVSVDSVPGNGTTVRVLLPIMEESGVGHAPLEPSPWRDAFRPSEAPA